MEADVQLFRALASRGRIRILRLLTVLGEQPVSDIAEATGQRGSVVSAHLRLLANVGLVWRRRSGRWVYYRVADRPRRGAARAVVASLRRVWRRIRRGDPRDVARTGLPESARGSDRALFALFTAFTHPRRIRIVQHLAHHEGCTTGELAGHLDMSICSSQRHVSKLKRRGIVTRVMRDDGRPTYVLGKPRGTVQRAVLQALLG